MPTIEELKSAIKSKLDEVDSIWQKSAQNGDELPTGNDRSTIVTRNKEIEELNARLEETKSFQNVRELQDSIRKQLNTPAPSPLPPIPLPTGGKTEDASVKAFRDGGTMGDYVMEQPSMKAFFERVLPNGPGSELTTAPIGQSPAISVPGNLKTLIAVGASLTSGAGSFVPHDRTGIVDAGTFYRPIQLLDIITNLQTDSNIVDYVQQGTHTNNAAGVAEATATSGASGTKPESAMNFNLVSAPVKTIAHWLPITRQALADAAQLRGYIDEFLRYGVQDALAANMLTGDGSGANLTGFVAAGNPLGINTQAFNTDLLTTIRKARTQCVVAGKAQPNAIVLNPADWETIDLLQDNEARYFFGGPMVLGTPRIWGMPVVEEQRMTAGTALVGDFRLAILWDRQQIAVYMTDSHQDFFIRNMLVILCEGRFAFGVLRPAAFTAAVLA